MWVGGVVPGRLYRVLLVWVERPCQSRREEITFLCASAIRRRRFQRPGHLVLHQCTRSVSGLEIGASSALGHHGHRRAVDFICGRAWMGSSGSPAFDRGRCALLPRVPPVLDTRCTCRNSSTLSKCEQQLARKACGAHPAGLAVLFARKLPYRGELCPTSRPPMFGL